MREIIYTNYPYERDPKFNTRTEIVIDNGIKKVYKYPKSEKSKAHVAQMYNYYNTCKDIVGKSDVRLCKCEKENDRLAFEYIEGDDIRAILCCLIKDGDISQVVCILEKFYEVITALCEEKEFHPSHEFMDVFGNVVPKYDGKILVMNPANIDLNFDNIILSDGKFVILDYEWTFSFDVPMEFILYRSLYNLLIHNLKFEELNLFEKFEISKENIEIYKDMEDTFQKYVLGDIHYVNEYHHRSIDVRNSVKNSELHFSIYEDYGNGFSENNRFFYMQNLTDKGEFEFTHVLTDGTKKIRLDPGEMPLVIDFGDYFEYSATNAYYCKGNKFYFSDVDPQLEIDLSSGIQKQITFKGRAEKIGDLTICEIDAIKDDHNKEISKLNDVINKNMQLLQKKDIAIEEKNELLQERDEALHKLENDVNSLNDLSRDLQFKLNYAHEHPVKHLIKKIIKDKRYRPTRD